MQQTDEFSNKFYTLVSEFVTNAKTTFSDDVELMKTDLGLKNIVGLLQSNKNALCASFFDASQCPVPASVKVKYRKAFVDLTKQELPIGALLFYQDFSAVFKAIDAADIRYFTVKLSDKYESGDAQTKQVFEKVIDSLFTLACNHKTQTSNARESFEASYPSIDALSERIAARKLEKAKQGSNAKAKSKAGAGAKPSLQASTDVDNLLGAIRALGPSVSKQYERAIADKNGDYENVRQAWKTVAGPEVMQAVKDRSMKTLVTVCRIDYYKTFRAAGHDADYDKFWQSLHEYLQFSTMLSCLPNNMVSTLEEEAHALMADLQNGRSIADLNMQEIGERVMQQCTSQDVQQLTTQLPQLLKAMPVDPTSLNLQSLQAQLAAGASPS